MSMPIMSTLNTIKMTAVYDGMTIIRKLFATISFLLTNGYIGFYFKLRLVTHVV